VATTTRESRCRRVNGKSGTPLIIGRRRNGFSCYNRFEGEAGTTDEKRAEQMQQQRVWLEMQIREGKNGREKDTKIENNRREIRENELGRRSQEVQLGSRRRTEKGTRISEQRVVQDNSFG